MCAHGASYRTPFHIGTFISDSSGGFTEPSQDRPPGSSCESAGAGSGTELDLPSWMTDRL